MNDVWEVDLGGDQESRARAWATEQVRARNEEEERLLKRYGPPPHAWKVPMRTDVPPGVIPWADMYIILEPEKGHHRSS